jgi:hypothetical protein
MSSFVFDAQVMRSRRSNTSTVLWRRRSGMFSMSGSM